MIGAVMIESAISDKNSWFEDALRSDNRYAPSAETRILVQGCARDLVTVNLLQVGEEAEGCRANLAVELLVHAPRVWARLSS